MKILAERDYKGLNPESQYEKKSEPIKRLNVTLIKPSKYDDDGYVIRHFRGILPSNTLACLYALTEDVERRKVLGGDLEIRTRMLDETVQKIDVKKIARSGSKKGVKTVIGLVGVQTNQFPRAYDLSLQFREAGVDVIIGGFHVSGLLSIFGDVPKDVQSLMKKGVSIVAGEVENHWGKILQDAVRGELKPLYDFLDDLPDMRNQPVPVVNKKYLRRFVFSNFGTIDCGRGCPFNCAFCTVINVHGRRVRCRDPEVIAEAIRKNYRTGISFYFFTDDNFARNKNWEPIFDMLIRLKSEEGIDVEFMMQVDVLSYKMDNFIVKAQAAGCTNVFIGMESVNSKNLSAAGKKQNVVEDYKYLISKWHRAGISTHVGYIIGFPGDTLESIKKDVQTLTEDLGVELASFFMLTPLPGSMDHLQMVRDGAYMDPDYNRYDSFHETVHHPGLRDGEWSEAYKYAWETFYSFENMKMILKQSNKHKRYWDTIWKFFWYKGATTIEKNHPMLTGLFRFKDRKNRRRGYEIRSIWAHMKMRSSEVFSYVVDLVQIWWEIQELWLQTRPQTAFEIKLVKEWKQLRESVAGRLTVLEWRPSPSRFWSSGRRVFRRINVFSLSGIQSRQDLNQFWGNARLCLSNRKFYRIRPIKLMMNSFRDLRISVHFLRSVNKGIGTQGQSLILPDAHRRSDRKTAVIALSLPQKFEELKRSIESFLGELGIDIVSYEGASNDLRNIDTGNSGNRLGTAGVVRCYLEGLKGKADFILLPFTAGLEHFHDNFIGGLSDVASDVKEKLSVLPRVIHFPIIETEAQALRESLIGLGLCFTDDIHGVVAASERAVSQTG